MTSESMGSAAITLLGDGELDTLALGQADPGLLLADDAEDHVSNLNRLWDLCLRLTRRCSHGWRTRCQRRP